MPPHTHTHENNIFIRMGKLGSQEVVLVSSLGCLLKEKPRGTKIAQLVLGWVRSVGLSCSHHPRSGGLGALR